MTGWDLHMFLFLFLPRRPCDINGDISYEELQAAAYDDARRGLSVHSIVSCQFFFRTQMS